MGVIAFAVPMVFNQREMPLVLMALVPLLLSLGAAAIIISAMTIPVETGWAWRSAAFVGAFSYSIYLFHLTFFNVGESIAARLHIPQTRVTLPPIQYATAIIGGIIIGKLIEIPALAFRDRVFPSRTGSPVQPDGETAHTYQPSDSPTKDVPSASWH